MISNNQGRIEDTNPHSGIPPKPVDRGSVQASVSKPLADIAELPSSQARTPPLSRLAERFGKPPGVASQVDRLRSSLNLSDVKREPDQLSLFRGTTARVRSFDGTSLEFKQGERLGSGAESTAFDARVQKEGRTHERAFVQIGRFADFKEQQQRFHELKSTHDAINKKAPIGVKVYGLSTVINPRIAAHQETTTSVGVLMDKGAPIFGETGLPKEERVAFCQKFLKGIEEMHANGLTHGDIKVAIERVQGEEKDSSNLMMRVNDQGEKEPCLIDWGESVDHEKLKQLPGQKAYEQAAWKVPSTAFTPYGLTTRLRSASEALAPQRGQPASAEKFDAYLDVRKKLDRFNTAVAIVQILSGHEEAMTIQKIRIEGASRGDDEPNIPELLRSIPEDTPKELRDFLETTLQEDFESK